MLFRDGLDNTGKFIAALAIPASSTGLLSLPSKGILLEIGLFVAFTAITGAGAAFIVPLWHYPATPPGE
jgi:hypothetical protein